MRRVALISDDERVRADLAALLSAAGYAVTAQRRVAAMLPRLRAFAPHLIVLAGPPRSTGSLDVPALLAQDTQLALVPLVVWGDDPAGGSQRGAARTAGPVVGTERH